MRYPWDRRERGAEFMRDDGDEIVLQPVQLRQLRVLDGGARTPMDRGCWEHEQRQQVRTPLSQDDHDGCQAQQHTGGHGLEREVPAEVVERRKVLCQGHRDLDHARVDEEESESRGDDGEQVAGRKSRGSTDRRVHPAGRRRGQHVARDVEEHFPQRLSPDVGSQHGRDHRHDRCSGAPPEHDREAEGGGGGDLLRLLATREPDRKQLADHREDPEQPERGRREPDLLDGVRLSQSDDDDDPGDRDGRNVQVDRSHPGTLHAHAPRSIERGAFRTTDCYPHFSPFGRMLPNPGRIERSARPRTAKARRRNFSFMTNHLLRNSIDLGAS